MSARYSSTVKMRAPMLGKVWLKCVCMLVVLWSAATAQVHALQVHDDRGVALTLARVPQRVVSLLPSLTETVCALGQCNRLVGIDRDSNYPQDVQKLPQLGSGLAPSIEAVLALRPDVVLMARSSSRAVERLQALGIAVLAFEPQTHADVARVISQLGTLFGVADAPELWRSIDASISAAAQSLPQHVRGVRVYFEVGQGYAAAEESFIGETLRRLAVRNIVPRSLGPFPKINPEYVVRADPDLIMVSQRAADGLAQRPGWLGLRALREGHWCTFSKAQADMLVRPGPRMAQGAWLMARCLSDKAPTRAAVISAVSPAHTALFKDTP